jgi:hypothetical protein
MTRWIGVLSITFLAGLLAGTIAHRAFSAGEPATTMEPPRTVRTPVEKGAIRPPEVGQPRGERPANAPWMAEIVARLDRAAAARHQLEQEMTALQEKVSALDARLTDAASGNVHSAAPGESGAPASANRDAAADPTIPLATRLTALGVDQDHAAEIAQRVNEIDLDRLYLRDQATREGWLNTPRYRETLREVNSDLTALREEVGDDAYDRYLYATGQVNRVVVGSVMAGSPAQEAGLKVGDTVLRYDDRRVFFASELQSATTGGVAGDWVNITVLRGSQTTRIYVPRGPLGIRLVAERRRPDALP